MGIEVQPNIGLFVPIGKYKKLKAFQSQGIFWDHQPQSLVRQHLGVFLPQVEIKTDNRGEMGWFRRFSGNKEVVSSSKSSGRVAVPQEQLDALRRSIDEFRRVAQSPDTQPNNREIIERFRLPDPEKDSDLYRLRGVPWNRQLEIIWGCEREEDSSLLPEEALGKLRVDRTYAFRKWMWWLFGLLLLAFLLWVLSSLFKGMKGVAQRLANDKPSIEVRIDSQDIPSRRVSLNLDGSRDKDGVIKGFDVDWGDGSPPERIAPENRQPSKVYPKDGQFRVKVKALDNLGAESQPAEMPLTFDHDVREKAKNDARLKAEADAFAERKRVAEDAAKKEGEAKAIREAQDAARELAQKETAERLQKEAKQKAEEAAAQTEKDRVAKEKERMAKDTAPTPPSATQPQQKGADSIGKESEDNSGMPVFRNVVTGRRVRVNFTPPKYPARAQREGVEGAVQVVFTVGTDARPKDFKLIGGSNTSYFYDDVVVAVRRAKFEPALSDGVSVEQQIGFDIKFTMDK